MVVVVVPVLKADENSRVSPHFGRAPFFAVGRVEGSKLVGLDFVENPHAVHSHSHGRGGHSHGDLIQLFSELGVGAVVVLHVGRRLLEDLVSLGVEVFAGVADKSVRENLLLFAKGELRRVGSGADLSFHDHH